MGVKSGRDWILTVSAEKHSLEEVQAALARYRWVGQLEEGKEHGFRHYQIAILNDNPIRFETLRKKFGDAHIEPRQGSRRDLYAYCTKRDTRVNGPWNGGDWADPDTVLKRGTEQGKRSDLAAVRDAVEAGQGFKQILLDSELSGSSAHAMQWLREAVEARRAVEASGRITEKTVIYGCESALSSKLRNDVYDLFEPDEIYEVDSVSRFDQYDGERVMVFPEFDWRAWPVDFITRLCDRYPVRLPARYQNHQLMADTVVFLSHEPATSLYQGFLGEGRVKLFSLIDQIVELFRDETYFDLSPKRMLREKPEVFEPLFAGQRPWTIRMEGNRRVLVLDSAPLPQLEGEPDEDEADGADCL